MGVHEYPLRAVAGVSALEMKESSAARALADAGLRSQDVDTIDDAAEGGGMAGVELIEYFGVRPNSIDATTSDGSSYELHPTHAQQAIAAGKVRLALFTYGAGAC